MVCCGTVRAATWCSLLESKVVGRVGAGEEPAEGVQQVFGKHCVFTIQMGLKGRVKGGGRAGKQLPGEKMSLLPFPLSPAHN